MRRALTLCSLLLLPLPGCDPDVAVDLAQHAKARPTPEPPAGGDLGADLCASYCDEYRDLCSDQFTYASTSECAALCSYWEDADTEENWTAECRRKALWSLDAGDPESLSAGCHEAGTVSEVCGPAYVITCERYCDLYDAACGDHSAFESEAKCLTWCGAETLEGEGDTVECRIDHLSGLAGPSCADASPDSSHCS
ncbi:MAG: hypothetical protein ACE37F_24510 [Nannocystaceae bacterium]|nr:hypothetical protein [bacterium]